MSATADTLVFWLVAVLAIAVCAALPGNAAVIVLFAVVSLQALREFLTLTHTRRADHWALAAAFFLVLPLQYVLIGIDWYGLSSVMIPVYAFLGLPIAAVLRGDHRRFMERIAEVQWGLMTCVYCVSYLPALLLLRIPGFDGRGVWLIVFVVVVVESSGLAGRLVADRRAAATMPVDPAEAGAVVATGAVLGALIAALTPFGTVVAAGFGALTAVLGLAGSLVLEAVKRDRGVADWRRGAADERHAPGLLDRMERLVFAAPVFFHLVRYWWTV